MAENKGNIPVVPLVVSGKIVPLKPVPGRRVDMLSEPEYGFETPLVPIPHGEIKVTCPPETIPVIVS